MPQSCYYPNGELSTTDTPCNASAPISACCGPDDACLKDTYCLDNTNNLIYRKSCTDANWGDYCPTVCHDVIQDQTAVLVPAELNPVTWCCNGYNASSGQCEYSTYGTFQPFQRKSGYIITDRSTGRTAPLGSVLSGSSAPGNGNSTVASPSTSDAASSPNTPHNLPTSSAACRSDSREVTVGASLGAILGVLLILIGLLYFLQLREASRAKRELKEERAALMAQLDSARNYNATIVPVGDQKQEIQFLSGTPVAELETSNTPK